MYFFITSLFDILNYPEYHSSVCSILILKIQLTTKLALYGCIAYSIDVICSFLFLPSIWKKLKWTKILCCILSWVFSLAFGLLYYVGDCSGRFRSVSRSQRAFCRWTSVFCGRPRTTASLCRTAPTRRVGVQPGDSSVVTILRYYPNCQLLNFVRGITEVGEERWRDA